MGVTIAKPQAARKPPFAQVCVGPASRAGPDGAKKCGSAKGCLNIVIAGLRPAGSPGELSKIISLEHQYASRASQPAPTSERAQRPAPRRLARSRQVVSLLTRPRAIWVHYTTYCTFVYVSSGKEFLRFARILAAAESCAEKYFAGLLTYGVLLCSPIGNLAL